MVKKVEVRILELLFEDITGGYSILEMSKKLSISYSLTYNTVQLLVKNGIISSEKKGNACIIKINFREIRKEQVYAEWSRRDAVVKKYYQIKSILDKLKKIRQTQFICILFGSYSKGNPRKNSDIDIVFIIPEEYDYGTFDRNVKTILAAYPVDIHISPETGLFEMWNTVKKRTVGNELLKGHIVLIGVESFLELRRRYEYG